MINRVTLSATKGLHFELLRRFFNRCGFRMTFAIKNPCQKNLTRDEVHPRFHPFSRLLSFGVVVSPFMKGGLRGICFPVFLESENPSPPLARLRFARLVAATVASDGGCLPFIKGGHPLLKSNNLTLFDTAIKLPYLAGLSLSSAR